MNSSILTGATGAIAQMQKMNIIANNLASTNSAGYKPKVTSFSELMQYNMHAQEDVNTRNQALVGVKVEKDDTNFAPSGLMATEGKLDYAITGDGFFKLRNPATNEITYSRFGHFIMSDGGDGDFYLINDSGRRVQNADNEDIKVTMKQDTGEYELSSDIGIFKFAQKNGMRSVGRNEFIPVEKNGEPYLAPESTVINGYLEQSGTDVAYEFTKMVEAQRAYSFSIRLITTSDEILQTVNSLRN